MNYVLRDHQGVILIEIFGPEWGSLAQLDLKDEVRAALALGHRTFVLDMSQASFVNSMGLGIIVAAWTVVVECGGVFRVCGANSRIQHTLGVCGLDRVLDIVPTRAEAVAKLTSSPPPGPNGRPGSPP